MKKKTHYSMLAAALLVGTGWSTTGHSDGVGLADVVRNATQSFSDLDLAAAAGYGQFLGCVSGPEEGAMGVHYANGALVGDDALDAARPEVLVYEPQHDGSLRLVAVEYLVLAEAWNAIHTSPPVLEGQTFHFTDSPNRYGLPAFYALHIWAWKHNPHGTFVNWNPNVSCEAYAPAGVPGGVAFGGMAPFGPLYFRQRQPRRCRRNATAGVNGGVARGSRAARLRKYDPFGRPAERARHYCPRRRCHRRAVARVAPCRDSGDRNRLPSCSPKPPYRSFPRPSYPGEMS